MNKELECCPGCGSGRIACLLSGGLDFCLACIRTWERLPAGEPYTRDGEMMPFKVPCDNCAYRGGSDERKDPVRWAELQAKLEAGGSFFCHKAVPFDARKMAEGSFPGFEFPQVTRTLTVEGKTHEYLSYDTSRMRTCRGFLNAHVAPHQKRNRTCKV